MEEFIFLLLLFVYSIGFVWALRSGKVYTRALIGRKVITRQDNPFLFRINILGAVIGLVILLVVNLSILLATLPDPEPSYRVYLSVVMK